MRPFSCTIQEQAEAFQRRITVSECFYRKAIAALAMNQVMQHIERVPESLWWRQLLWASCRVLARVGRWLGRRLLSLAFRRRRRHVETWQWEISDTAPLPPCWLLTDNPGKERSSNYE